MFQPIQISIPAEKFTEDVYIILQEGDVYRASKALKETYIVTMPTQQQQKTVTCYGTNGEVVAPFEGLYFRTIEEITNKLDEINNRKVQAIYLCVVNAIRENYPIYGRADWEIKHREKIENIKGVTKENLYEKLSFIFSDIEKNKALSNIQNKRYK